MMKKIAHYIFSSLSWFLLSNIVGFLMAMLFGGQGGMLFVTLGFFIGIFGAIIQPLYLSYIVEIKPFPTYQPVVTTLIILLFLSIAFALYNYGSNPVPFFGFVLGYGFAPALICSVVVHKYFLHIKKQ